MRGRTRSATWHASSRVGKGRRQPITSMHRSSTNVHRPQSNSNRYKAKQSTAQQSHASWLIGLGWVLHISQPFMPKHYKFSHRLSGRSARERTSTCVWKDSFFKLFRLSFMPSSCGGCIKGRFPFPNRKGKPTADVDCIIVPLGKRTIDG